MFSVQVRTKPFYNVFYECLQLLMYADVMIHDS